MHEYEAGITRTEYRGNNTYLIDLDCGDIARDAVPGQFIQIRAASGTDPFLRRSISLCGTFPDRGVIRVLIDVIGPGTGMVCSMKRGNTLNIIGPLGNGFDPNLGGHTPCILAAGGIGSAPLIFLAKRIIQLTPRPVTFLFGAGNAGALGIVKGLIPGSVETLYATDDGSAGFHGYAGALLRDRMADIRPGAVYVCGPAAMLKDAATAAMDAGVPCEVSFEERMACGIGACYGCVVEHNDGRMLRSCVDGPVFSADEVYK